MIKIVNGCPVEMSADDVSALLAEREAAAMLAEPVPKSISHTQGEIILHRMGLLDTVEQMVAVADKETQIAYRANIWNRTSPTLNALAAALGLSSDQLDDLFRQAAAIEI